MKFIRFIPIVISLMLVNQAHFAEQQTSGRFLPTEKVSIDPAEGIISTIEGIELEEWQIADDIVKYIPENLYEKINGRAEYYLSYNMNFMIYARYTKGPDKFPSINLSVFDVMRRIPD